MNCHRCQGCMVRDHFVDLLESGGEWWTTTWRCINCGYVLDAVLEQNRRKQHDERMVTAASIVVSQDSCLDEELAELDSAA
ncbi:MAG: hypothetical protein P0111_12600 [Nitrospira sp.]|nr:hypothetical protein [Nitrospira sp.]